MKESLERILECISEEIEVDDDHWMEKLEEVRRCLKSFLKPEVLQSLLELYKVLDIGPEQYHGLVRASIAGRECRFALQALAVFKNKRIHKVKHLLKEALQILEEVEVND